MNVISTTKGSFLCLATYSSLYDPTPRRFGCVNLIVELGCPKQHDPFWVVQVALITALMMTDFHRREDGFLQLIWTLMFSTAFRKNLRSSGGSTQEKRGSREYPTVQTPLWLF